MSANKRYNLKAIIEAVLWVLFGSGTIVLLGAAMYKKENNHCKAISINIESATNNLFIDKTDVNRMLEKMNLGKLKVKPIDKINLAKMEITLKRNPWIRSAELYFDNNDVLRIDITERTPVARVFSSSGSSYYIDSSIKRLPLSSKFSARLPVFTNYPYTPDSYAKADSVLLTDIKNISTYIVNNPFWMAQIDQVDITPQLTFEMIPKIGNQLIIFGSAENYVEKFHNLFTFYKNVQSRVGWNKYSSINVSYQNQVVAVKRGAGDIKSDSLKTIQLIKVLVANAQKQANDSANNIQLVQPKEDNIIPFAQPLNEEVSDEQDLIDGSSPKQNQVEFNTTDNKMPEAPASLQNDKTNKPFPYIKSNAIEKPNSVSSKKLKNLKLKNPRLNISILKL